MTTADTFARGATPKTAARRPTVSRPELMPDGDDRRFRQFVHDVLAFSSRAAEVRAGFGQHIGLSGVAYTTLISIAELERAEGGVGISRLAEHLHLSGAFVTLEVAKLVRAGLVAKRTNATDRRRVLLTITEGGRRRLDSLVPVQAPVNDALFECLSEADFLRLSELMGRLVRCGDEALALMSYLTRGAVDRRGRLPDDVAEDVPATSGT